MLAQIALVAGLIVLGLIVTMATFSLLSRKPDNLGLREGRLAPCPATPNCVCSLDNDAGHAIEPLRFTDAPDAAWQRLQRVLAAQPRCGIASDDGTYLHAEFASLLFRFVDDVEFHRGDGLIHVRSASRAGRGDLGVNRARIEAIRAAFDNL